MMNQATEQPTKRFIAGAVCPACSEPDSVKMWDVDGVPHRECVVCGYADTLNAQGNRYPWNSARGSTRSSPSRPTRRCSRYSSFPIRS